MNAFVSKGTLNPLHCACPVSEVTEASPSPSVELSPLTETSKANRTSACSWPTNGTR